MSEVSASRLGDVAPLARPSSFAVEDIYWGYIVKSGRGTPVGLALVQIVSFFFGVSFLTAAAGMMLVPTLMMDGDLGPMRIGAAVLLGAVAFYLLWFASRGSQPELHVDTSTGEIREVIVNRAGRPTTVGCYGFDTIGGVFLEPHTVENWATLVLRYRNTAQTVTVAQGIEAQLIPLRDRLAQDLMVDLRAPRSGRSRAA